MNENSDPGTRGNSHRLVLAASAQHTMTAFSGIVIQSVGKNPHLRTVPGNKLREFSEDGRRGRCRRRWSDSYRYLQLRVRDPPNLSVAASVCHLPLRPTGSDHSEERLTRVIEDRTRKMVRLKVGDSAWWLKASVQGDGVSLVGRRIVRCELTVETITRWFSRQRREISGGTPLTFSKHFSFERENG